jgi:hypothetical protein
MPAERRDVSCLAVTGYERLALLGAREARA